MTLSNHDYTNWLSDVKLCIVTARSRAALAVNAELIQLYHHIAQDILRKQVEQSWGSKAIDRLAQDLKEAFPGIKRFSARNLKYMRNFAEHCPSLQFGQQAAAQLPWFHIVTLLTKLSDAQQRAWYAEQAITQGWLRESLERHIETQLMLRSGNAVSNFAMCLPSPTSQLAQEILKYPYLFDFLGLSDDAQEREIENAMVKHITKVLLELGYGFTFVGQQQRVEVAEDEFFIDLLFYHIKLKCYVVVELKATAFKPEYIGQLDFYLSVVDAQIKAEDDNPTIGLLLCRKHNKLVAQYAVNGIDKPIGVADYHLLTSLPESLMINLPSIEALEQELEGIT